MVMGKHIVEATESLFDKRNAKKILFVSTAIFLVSFTNELSAANSGLASLLNDAHNEIHSNLLKPASKLGAMGGAVMAMFRAFTASGYGPVVMWGGTAIFASVLPTIIEKLFG